MIREQKIVSTGRRAVRAVTMVLFAVLCTGAAACKPRCEVITAHATETPAAPFCDDLTNIPADIQDSVRGLVNAYADRIPLETEKLQPLQTLNDIDGEVTSKIWPSKGTRELVFEDFKRRGRIVATITSSGAYKHGVVARTTYMWVERDTQRGWRVLMIPADPHLPIAVMPMIEVKHDLPGGAAGRQTASLIRYDSDTAWIGDMSPAVSSCFSDSIPGCWVHSNVSTSRLANDFEGASDVWVWVTGRGCICVGNKCHAATTRTHDGATQ